MTHVARCLVFAALLLAAPLASTQSASDNATTGRRVDFPLASFQDTLFTGVDGALRVRMDDDGHLWYSTEGGVVHVDPQRGSRELFTKFEGLPSSYSLGLNVAGDKVYVGTDLGVGIIDRGTGEIREITPLNSPLPDQIVYDVVPVGGDLWIGTRFFGVAVWNMSQPLDAASAWTFKNTSTTPGYAEAVRRIVPTSKAVWIATEGDGVWRYDRASRTWNVTVQEDGLPDRTVLSVAERGNDVWFATPSGLAVRNAAGAFRVYNKTHGLPDDRVLDVDVIPTLNETMDVFASTKRGLWQLEPETGKNATRSQGFGILGAYIFDNEFTAKGWLFATTRGVSLYRGGSWSYYATGPSTGASWGPLAFGFTSASVGEANPWLWFGTQRGLSAYRLPAGGNPGFWQNFGEWQNYPGSVVNWIDTDGNVTWFGTNSGTYGFEHDTGRWLSKIARNSRNLVYGLEADRGELWIGLFGDGLVAENLTTGLVRTWDATSVADRLPDLYITDVRAGAGDDMWLGSSIGVMRLDRVTGSLRNTYTKADGIPGAGVTFRVLPEGASVWIGTQDDGVAKLDVASGKVSRVWNHTTHASFPEGEVRSLYREGGRLWVGTTQGLARVDVTTQEVRSWNQSNSGLVQNIVNGITSADGVLYLATLSGVQRLNVATGEFYPMRDGPGVVRTPPTGEPQRPGLVTVNLRIDAPRDGGAVFGPTQIRGTALSFGASVDRVEIRIGAGEWARAAGAESWSFDWDPTGLPANEPVTIGVRAFAQNATDEEEIIVTPVAPPTVELRIEEAREPERAFAGRPLQFAARAEGDEPLTASLFYKPAGTSSYQRLALQRQGNLFLGTLPAVDVREGEMRYYYEAHSGLLVKTAGGDAGNPSVLQVGPTPRLALRVEGPPLVDAVAGEPAAFALRVTNDGTEPATFTLAASGLRAAWVSVPPEDLALEPAEAREVQVRLQVPATAFADQTTLTFVARDSAGLAEPAQASVPVRIAAAELPPTPDPAPAPERGGRVVPVPAALAVFALALAFAWRRRS